MKYTKTILTVSQLNNLSGKILEREFGAVAVTGEISNFTHHSSGHMYFTLNDDKAAIGAVMFKGYNRRLRFSPRRGDEVTVNGTVSIFAPQGRYQFIVKTMTKSGLGRLEKEFLKLKEKLKEDGLFEQSHKKPLPPIPKKIGVVTSPTGAAIRDIINVITRRAGNIEIVIFPSRVQGKEAAGEISGAIEYFNNNYKDIEVLIVGRGGGSLEDLWPFNEEKVARTIFNSDIPVISAVGHETDFTISDFTADLRAPTPSAAAELVIKDRGSLAERMEKASDIFKKSILQRLNSSKMRYDNLVKSTQMRYPMRIYQQHMQNLDYLSEKLTGAARNIVENNKNRTSRERARLKSLSPLATLKRGYSITYLKALVSEEKIPVRKSAVRKSATRKRVARENAVLKNSALKSSVGLKEGDKLKNIFYNGETLS
nr:exodeoxyribonuclease VII large subunit [Elusimicrobiota bacterium]